MLFRFLDRTARHALDLVVLRLRTTDAKDVEILVLATNLLYCVARSPARALMTPIGPCSLP
jgi:hypothetical protein